MLRKRRFLIPDDWDLKGNSKGELLIGNCNSIEIADKYGTPLHVVNEDRLNLTINNMFKSFRSVYSGKVSFHYAFKCNSVPAIVQLIKKAGMKAEVMSDYELELALHLGYKGSDIIVNGPCKTGNFLHKCLLSNTRFIVIDSLGEFISIEEICKSDRLAADILLRINPDYVPEGMNSGASTGSRKGCAFGLDLKDREVEEAFKLLKKSRHIKFHGFHFHIGTGIRNPADYSNALTVISSLFDLAEKYEYRVNVLDVGGGFASMTSREMTTREMLIYQGLNQMPAAPDTSKKVTFKDFAITISKTVGKYFNSKQIPELILEPGRSVVSSNQLLLIKVHRIKKRSDIAKWLITDGGLGTVSMPTFYEYHEILLCNDINRPRTEKVNIIGPVCFASDIVYKNKLMPAIEEGEVLAIMDSGAYFTALESSFGFSRPAIVGVNKDGHHLLRRVETFQDMIQRDSLIY